LQLLFNCCFAIVVALVVATVVAAIVVATVVLQLLLQFAKQKFTAFCEDFLGFTSVRTSWAFASVRTS